jgi:outer membrane protein insertion porin family
MVWFLIVLLLWPSLAESQTRQRGKPPAKTSAKAPTRWPIEGLRVEGNQNYTSEQILAVAGLKVGEMAGKAEFEAARDRLVAAGAFERVGYRFEPSASGKGYAASFQVVEFAEVYPFRFERLGVAPEQLEEWLKRSDPLFGAKIPATREVLERYSRQIEEFLATKNIKEKVIGKVTADAPERLVVVFRPAAPLPSVAEVKFTNNKVIPAKTLQNAVAGTAVGSVYTEERFRQILDMSIRPLYEARGRVRVAFRNIQTEKAKEVKGLVVTVEIAEGESYELGEVRFEGEGLPEQELRKAGDFKTGDVANFTEIQAGLERVKKRLRRKGYMHPEARVERHIQDKRKTVDLTVQVDKGPQYVFGKLMLEGLGMHGEAAIKRLWTLKPGAPFNANYPDYFLQRVREDGIFENLGKTKSTLKIDEQSRTVDVTLCFGPDCLPTL